MRPLGWYTPVNYKQGHKQVGAHQGAGAACRVYRSLIPSLWSATLLTYSPDMALNDSSCSHDDPEILPQSLTISHTIPNSQFQRCFKQRHKCWTRRINSEWDNDDNRNNTTQHNTTTTTNYKGTLILRYRLSPETPSCP